MTACSWWCQPPSTATIIIGTTVATIAVIAYWRADLSDAPADQTVGDNPYLIDDE